MKRIVCLEPLIANQIAAGEVVEKAASVIKELVENSLDAGATKIEIEVEGAGIHLIRVRDNGHGIIKEDLPLAFFRHATSKISTSEDLTAIMSLGFRGEALASIAAVAKCTLQSKALSSLEAWQIQIHPDLQTTLSPVAHAQGSTIEVTDLFYNTPVRRKFLRSEKSENLAIEETIKRLALAAPQVNFTYKQNQKLIRRYDAALDFTAIEARVGNIVGQAFMRQAKAVHFEREGLTLKGWIGLPDLQKRHADCQYFFVNQRAVKDRLLSHAIRTCYQRHHQFTEGTYPAYVLFLTLDPAEIDVNVHPTKQEVRFSQAVRIYDFINQGIEKAWGETPILKEEKIHSTYKVNKVKAQKPINETEELQSLISGKRYILIEQVEGIKIIDLHFAKNDLLKHYFEKYKGRIPKRPLLFPLEVALPLLNKSVETIIEILEQVGFECRFENNRMLVFQQPVLLEKPIEVLSFLKLIESLNSSVSDDFFIESLSRLCSHNVLHTLNWSEYNLANIPSVNLTHEDIANAIKV